MDSQLDGIVGGGAVETGKWGLGGVLGRSVQGIWSLPVYDLDWLSWSMMIWIAALCYILPLLSESSQLHRAVVGSYTWLTRGQVLLQGPSTVLVGMKSSPPHFLDAVLADRHFATKSWLHVFLVEFRWTQCFSVMLTGVSSSSKTCFSCVVAPSCFVSWKEPAFTWAVTWLWRCFWLCGFISFKSRAKRKPKKLPTMILRASQSPMHWLHPPELSSV